LGGTICVVENEILYKESRKVKPLAREGKKAQSVVKGSVVAFSSLAGCARNLSLTWRTLRKEKISIMFLQCFTFFPCKHKVSKPSFFFYFSFLFFFMPHQSQDTPC